MNQAHFPGGERPLYRLLSSTVNQYFQSTSLPRSGDIRLYRKALIIASLFVASFAGILLSEGALNIGFWALHGVATALVGFNIMHDGAHQSFSRSRRLNQLCAFTFNLIGSNRSYWAQKHNRNHHAFTNVDDVDEDIDALGLFRMSPHQKRYWFHRGQHIYVWLLYPLTSLFWFFVLDYKAYFRQKIGQKDFSHRLTVAEHAEFWASKVLYILLYLVLPASLPGEHNVLIGFLLMHAILGFLFAVVFQLAHVVDQAEFPQPAADGSMTSEWAEHQLRTTVDFATSSRVLTWALGGLNFQVEHHLFPRVSHVHYPRLHALLSETCRQQGLPIRSYPTLAQALKAHYRHLRSMGQPQSEPAARH